MGVCVFVFQFLWQLHFFSSQPDFFVSSWITHVFFSQFMVCFSVSQNDFSVLVGWLSFSYVGWMCSCWLLFLYLILSSPFRSFLFQLHERIILVCTLSSVGVTFSYILHGGIVLLSVFSNILMLWWDYGDDVAMCVCFFLYVSSLTFTYNIVRQFHSFSSYTFLVKLYTHIARPFSHSLLLWSFVSCAVVCMYCTGCNVMCHNDNDDARRLHEYGGV